MQPVGSIFTFGRPSLPDLLGKGADLAGYNTWQVNYNSTDSANFRRYMAAVNEPTPSLALLLCSNLGGIPISFTYNFLVGASGGSAPGGASLEIRTAVAPTSVNIFTHPDNYTFGCTPGNMAHINGNVWRTASRPDGFGRCEFRFSRGGSFTSPCPENSAVATILCYIPKSITVTHQPQSWGTAQRL